MPFVNEQERLLLHYGDISGKDRSTLFGKFRDFFVILHKMRVNFLHPPRKCRMTFFRKIAIIQIKTPHAIHLPPPAGYNQNATWESRTNMKIRRKKL